METDADRLESIQALGGRLHLIDGQEVWSIFDDSPLETLTQPGVEGRVPVLECRTSDVINAQKEQSVSVDSEIYRVKRVERNAPAPGWTTLYLKR